MNKKQNADNAAMPKTTFLFPLTAFLIALAILWGNVVARQGYGLACPDWPLCHGKLIPPLRVDVLVEYSHRLVAMLLTFCMLASTVEVYRHYPRAYKKIVSLVLVLLAIQIVLGGITVLLKLPAIITIVHLTNSLLIFMLFLYMTFSSYRRLTGLQTPSSLFLVPLIFVYLQSVFGAIMRHTFSGMACPEFPVCSGGQWIPYGLSVQMMIHLLHRNFGYIVFLVVLLTSANCWKYGLKPQAIFLCGTVTLQIFLGAASVLSRLSTIIVTLHLANALVLVAYLVYQSVNISEQTLQERKLHYETIAT